MTRTGIATARMKLTSLLPRPSRESRRRSRSPPRRRRGRMRAPDEPGHDPDREKQTRQSPPPRSRPPSRPESPAGSRRPERTRIAIGRMERRKAASGIQVQSPASSSSATKCRRSRRVGPCPPGSGPGPRGRSATVHRSRPAARPTATAWPGRTARRRVSPRPPPSRHAEVDDRNQEPRSSVTRMRKRSRLPAILISGGAP